MAEELAEEKSIDNFRGGFTLLAGVVGLAVGVFVVALVLDLAVAPTTLDELMSAVNREGLGAAMGGLAEVLAAVLGLSLTVVAIVVQLASARYPAKIVDLFMFDPVNVGVFGFMAASCIYTVLVSLLSIPTAPVVATSVGIVLAVVNFGLLLPYFGHVFAFLEPNNIITRIEGRARGFLETAARGGLSDSGVKTAQLQVAAGVERIADNCMAAVGQSDRNLALHSVRTLEQFVVNYLGVKRNLPDKWDEVEWEFFGTLAQEFVDEIVERGTWLEAKTLMEFERVLRRALDEMGEVVSQLAASTRAMGVAAIKHDDRDFIELVVRFFNTYIRHGLNKRNVRAIYNILYEYRRFALAIFHWDPTVGTRIVEHLVYYGRSSNDMGMPFVTVTCAHDVRVLCQEVYGDDSIDINKLLGLFLTLDQPSEHKSEEVALIGVRKAQSILGAFFLLRGADELADKIRRDMQHENNTRLAAIRDEILAIKERKFWEITDRGLNFDYVEEDLRPHVKAFFEPLLKR